MVKILLAAPDHACHVFRAGCIPGFVRGSDGGLQFGHCIAALDALPEIGIRASYFGSVTFLRIAFERQALQFWVELQGFDIGIRGDIVEGCDFFPGKIGVGVSGRGNE